MRKNFTYVANIPTTRNDFIDCVKEKKEAIVLRNQLLIELDKELKLNQNKGKAKNILKTAGITGLLVLNLYNPLVWIFGLGSLLAGGLLKNDIKEYSAHKGTDMNGKEILVLIHKKKVNKKFDTVISDGKHADIDGIDLNKIIK
ncbi:MAG: hypothetical protein IJ002_08485 [Clostridia bacterium]|nr:hypothetical protein [Clostridia bacterium]